MWKEISERQPRWRVEFTKWQRWVFAKQNEQAAVLLQRALGAATFQSALHFLWVRGAVSAAENHLPPPALGDATANTRGRCSLAGSGTVHAGYLAGGRACSHGVVALQLLPQHLSLTLLLWTLVERRDTDETLMKILTLNRSQWFPSFSFTLSRLTCVTGGSGEPGLTVADRLSNLWHATLPVSAALPPAGRRLLSSIAILTLLAFMTLTTVGLTLWHTHTLNTSGAWGRGRGRGTGTTD